MPARSEIVSSVFVVLVLIIGLACSGSDRAQPHVVTQALPTPDTRAITCGPLPATMPQHLSFHIGRTVVPQGQSTRTEEAEMVTDIAACTQHAHCEVSRDAAMRALYELARRNGLDRTRTRPALHDPHFGSRSITVTWTTGRCEIGESYASEIDAIDQPGFNELFDAIVLAFINVQLGDSS